MNKIAPDDQQFPEQGMTFIEFVQYVIPDLSDEEADQVLWECTPFPLAMGRDDLQPRLEAIRDRLADGDTLDDIIDEIYDDMCEDEEAGAGLRQALRDYRPPKRRPVTDVESPLL